ncbi:MAG: hypothetical protein KGD57_04995 [Candidatus Lokiarchaeota archaeon]|nr:hypothetical protein [Candidatus Lokiarchaeota archaeon]
MAKKEPSAKPAGGEVLFVKSKVRDFIKSKGCNTSGDVIDGSVLNNRVIELLNKAVARSKANGRKTVQEKDL